MQPLTISVTLPNFNHGRYLGMALEAIVRQTYPHWEILFVDDGSTDGSRRIAEEYAAKDSRIRSVYFERNQGALAAHANAWSRVGGELVYQYSSDDTVTDLTFFESAVAALNQFPSAGGYFGVAAIMGAETGQVTGTMGHAIPGYINPLKFLAGFLRFQFFVPGISSIWRKAAIDAVGGYDSALGAQTDYFINHAIPAKFGAVFDPKLCSVARVSESNNSFSSLTSLEAEKGRFDLFEKKMKAYLPESSAPESDWAIWRAAKYSELESRHAERK
jgi:glycosyltransferase involved in cell wall biosynthesis